MSLFCHRWPILMSRPASVSTRGRFSKGLQDVLTYSTQYILPPLLHQEHQAPHLKESRMPPAYYSPLHIISSARTPILTPSPKRYFKKHNTAYFLLYTPEKPCLVKYPAYPINMPDKNILVFNFL